MDVQTDKYWRFGSGAYGVYCFKFSFFDQPSAKGRLVLLNILRLINTKLCTV